MYEIERDKDFSKILTLCGILGIDELFVHKDLFDHIFSFFATSFKVERIAQPFNKQLKTNMFHVVSISINGIKITNKDYKIKYKSLVNGDIIDKDDEFLDDDCITWAKAERWSIGARWNQVGFKSFRRPQH